MQAPSIHHRWQVTDPLIGGAAGGGGVYEGGGGCNAAFHLPWKSELGAGSDATASYEVGKQDSDDHGS